MKLTAAVVPLFVAALCSSALAEAPHGQTGSSGRVAANSAEGRAIQAEIEALTRQIDAASVARPAHRVVSRWHGRTAAPPYPSTPYADTALVVFDRYEGPGATASAPLATRGRSTARLRRQESLLARRAALIARLDPAS